MNEFELHDAVIAELAKAGLEASLEYPGAVVIEFPGGGRCLWTGLTGWDFGSVNRLIDDIWEPADESIEVELDQNETDPHKIAQAWFDAMAKVDGIDTGGDPSH